jgi:hypothetical protein
VFHVAVVCTLQATAKFFWSITDRASDPLPLNEFCCKLSNPSDHTPHILRYRANLPTFTDDQRIEAEKLLLKLASPDGTGLGPVASSTLAELNRKWKADITKPSISKLQMRALTCLHAVDGF